MSRWSRLKRESREEPAQADPAAPRELSPADPQSPPPELPPVASLNADSDFRPFFHPSVDEDLRRSALKKLFADPRFNVIDTMDIDIDDYSKLEPLAPAVAATLRQARRIIDWARESEEERKRAEADRAKAATAEPEPAPEDPQQSPSAAAEAPDTQRADPFEPPARSRS